MEIEKGSKPPIRWYWSYCRCFLNDFGRWRMVLWALFWVIRLTTTGIPLEDTNVSPFENSSSDLIQPKIPLVRSLRNAFCASNIEPSPSNAFRWRVRRFRSVISSEAETGSVPKGNSCHFFVFFAAFWDFIHFYTQFFIKKNQMFGFETDPKIHCTSSSTLRPRRVSGWRKNGWKNDKIEPNKLFFC